MRHRVIILPNAERDIEINARWWAENHSVEQAVRWFDAIHEQIKTLGNSPQSHSISPENGNFPYEIRDKLLGLGSRPSYRAVFTIRDDAVYVLAVRRAAQNAVHPSEFDAPPSQNDPE